MLCFYGLPDKYGGGCGEGGGLFGGKVADGTTASERAVDGRMAVKVVAKAAGDVLALGDEAHVRRRVGANLI